MEPLPTVTTAGHDTYTHEANRLHRTLSHGDSGQRHHSQLAVPHILLAPTPRHNVAGRHAVATFEHGGRSGRPDPNTSYDTVDPINVCEAPVW